MIINGDLQFLALDGGANSIKNAFIEQIAGDVGGGSLPAYGGGTLGSPATGRIVYNTDDNLYYFYNGSAWTSFASGGTAGGLQAELDDTQASLGTFINTDGSFNAVPLNALDNVTGLTGTSTLLDALTQLDTAISDAAGVDTLGELTDVTLTGLAGKDVLAYTGSGWVNRTRDGNDLVTKETVQTLTGAKTMDANLTMAATRQLIIAADGTESTPALHFAGDPNTGFYTIGPDEFGIAQGGDSTVQFIADDGTANSSITSQGNIRANNQFVGETETSTTPAFAFTSSLTTGLGFDPNGGGESGPLLYLRQGTTNVFEYDGDADVLTIGGLDATQYALDVATFGDSAIPNVKYVDDAINASAVAELGDIGDVVLTSPLNNDFLVYTGTQWVNETPSSARASLSVYSIAQVDSNFVAVAGDTMTGDLTMSGAVIANSLGSAAAPSYTFAGDTDTGVSAATANTLVISAGGSAVATFGAGNTTFASEIIVPGGTAGGPTFTFAGDTDTGVYLGGTNTLSFATNGLQRISVQNDGTLVANTASYETLVLDDNDIPNKKYVDDEVSNLATTQTLGQHADVNLAGLTDDSFLVYDSSGPEWVAETPATARTTLGLVAGGAGDIWVEKAGDSMSGNLDMASNFIVNLADPVNGQDAATKTYVDNTASGLSVRAAVDVLADTNAIDSVGGTWTYDNGVSGVNATLTRTTNGAAGTIDGIATTLNERVLVAGRTNAWENGIYVVTQLGDGSNPTILTRCGSCDEADEIPSSFAFVQQGTVYEDTGWVATVDDPQTFVVGNTTGDGDIDWLQFSGSGSIQAGTGLTLTGTTLDVNLGAGIAELPSDEVGLDLFDASTGAIILTTDGTARSTATGAQLHLLLDSNGSLTQGAGGLSVAATTFTGNTGSDGTILPGESIAFVGTGAISTDVTTNNVEISVDVATEAASQGDGTLGVAEFADGDFVVTSGFVELDPVGVQAAVSFTFSPISGDDITLTGTDDTLNIDSDTLTVSGDSGTATITIDLNAVLSDLNDVTVAIGGTTVVFDDARERVYDQGGENAIWQQDLLGYVTRDAAIAGYATATIQRGPQLIAWDPYDQDWQTLWGDTILNAVGMTGFYEWQANATLVADDISTHTVITGTGWTQDASINEAGAVFARWDVVNNSWRNFTPAQMVDMLNAQGGLTGVVGSITAAGDTGTPQQIDFGQTLTIAGGTGINTAAGATDTVTVSFDGGDVSVGDLSDVDTTGQAAGEALVYDGTSNYVPRPLHYVSPLTSSATSHTITHNLNQQFVNVTVVDVSDQVIIPQSITMTSATQVTVTLSSAAEIRVICTGMEL